MQNTRTNEKDRKKKLLSVVPSPILFKIISEETESDQKRNKV